MGTVDRLARRTRAPLEIVLVEEGRIRSSIRYGRWLHLTGPIRPGRITELSRDGRWSIAGGAEPARAIQIPAGPSDSGRRRASRLVVRAVTTWRLQSRPTSVLRC
ncbi:hypothetical protein D3C76_1079120 [compost metagenome]